MVAYERGDGGFLMDLKILRPSVLSMMPLLLPTISTVKRHPSLITREATHIWVWQTANVTFWDGT